MNFYQLECFVKAVERRNFAEVANEMHVTQPTVTYQITNLEKELNEKLFVRTTRGVEPTELGLVFYEDARKILAAYQDALDHFQASKCEHRSEFRIGFSRYPDNHDIFASIQKFRQEHPEAQIQVELGHLVDSVEELRQGNYDLLFHYKYEETELAGLEFIPLGYAVYYVLMSQSYPLAQYDALTIEDLAGHKVLTPEEYRYSKFQIPSLDALKKIGADVSLSYRSHSLLVYSISDGVGVGIYPAKYNTVGEGLKRVPLISQAPLEYGLLYRKGDTAPVLKAILQRLCMDLFDL